jgi:hypothetical protein
MSKRLEIPPELQHLIEKRESETDRRNRDDRAVGERREENLGPIGAIESAEKLEDVPTEERRTQIDRRKGGERRRNPRRKDGT